MRDAHWSLIWALVGVIIIALEFYGLGADQAPWTLSATVRLVRFDPIGRFVLLPLWCWLTLHLLIAPKWAGTHPTGWRDAIALAIGVAWAVWEARR
jgi:hypothetical protein